MELTTPPARYTDPGAALRIIRFGILCVVGMVMLVLSLGPKGDSIGNSTGWAYQHMGPHGNAIMGVIVGALFAAVGAWGVIRAVRRIRAARGQYTI